MPSESFSGKIFELIGSPIMDLNGRKKNENNGELLGGFITK